VEADFAKALGQPRSPRGLAKRGRRNTRHLHLPLRQLRLLRAQPVVGRTHLRGSRQARHILLRRWRNVRHIRTWGSRTHERYCVILQRTENKRDYLGREPAPAIDTVELTRWAREGWTFVTSLFLSS